MTMKDMVATARMLVADGRGLLAMDESTGTCNSRFAAAGIPQTEAARRAYRAMLVTTPELGTCISGAILYDETIRQQTDAGVPFVRVLEQAGIIPGIKVDTGAKDLALQSGEKVTEGLDGLRERLREYAGMGARFSKWRAVLGIGQGGLGQSLPTRACITANAQALARYASLCQEAGLVPIVEPEVLMTGAHTIDRCLDATSEALLAVFDALQVQGVAVEAVILKPNMVLPGLACPTQPTAEETATATLTCLLRCVPAATAGIAFLSGGQSAELASARLNAINLLAKAHAGRAPWPLAFSFARALQQPALAIWRGADANHVAAQQALLHRARCNRSAMLGEYQIAEEGVAKVGHSE